VCGNLLLATETVLNPLRVVVKTACSACRRRPTRSSTSLCARRLSAATAYPIGVLAVEEVSDLAKM
jgi:hypothetical protein